MKNNHDEKPFLFLA